MLSEASHPVPRVLPHAPTTLRGATTLRERSRCHQLYKIQHSRNWVLPARRGNQQASQGERRGSARALPRRLETCQYPRTTPQHRDRRLEIWSQRAWIRPSDTISEGKLQRRHNGGPAMAGARSGPRGPGSAHRPPAWHLLWRSPRHGLSIRKVKQGHPNLRWIGGFSWAGSSWPAAIPCQSWRGREGWGSSGGVGGGRV